MTIIISIIVIVIIVTVIIVIHTCHNKKWTALVRTSGDVASDIYTRRFPQQLL